MFKLWDFNSDIRSIQELVRVMEEEAVRWGDQVFVRNNQVFGFHTKPFNAFCHQASFAHPSAQSGYPISKSSMCFFYKVWTFDFCGWLTHHFHSITLYYCTLAHCISNTIQVPEHGGTHHSYERSLLCFGSIE